MSRSESIAWQILQQLGSSFAMHVASKHKYDAVNAKSHCSPDRPGVLDALFKAPDTNSFLLPACTWQGDSVAHFEGSPCKQWHRRASHRRGKPSLIRRKVQVAIEALGALRSPSGASKPYNIAQLDNSFGKHSMADLAAVRFVFCHACSIEAKIRCSQPEKPLFARQARSAVQGSVYRVQSTGCRAQGLGSG